MSVSRELGESLGKQTDISAMICWNYLHITLEQWSREEQYWATCILWAGLLSLLALVLSF